MLEPLKTLPLTLVLEDLGLKPERIRTLGDPPATPHAEQHALLAVRGTGGEEREGILGFAAENVSPEGTLLVFQHGPLRPRELARRREQLWPEFHVGAWYEVSNSGIVRHTLEGTQRLRGASGLGGALLVARRRAHVLSPAATVAKFDQNAPGWNGGVAGPGGPGHAHFRWMRRHVAHFAEAPGARRILDFGCGAGWVGIEAALRAPQAELCAFDPSPEMVKLAETNARASGVTRFTGRTGFGDAPPFPAAGEERFDLVLSSGVISFAPDAERFLDGLCSTLAPGGTLVVGDLQPASRGMRSRRRERALLPVRELNALGHDEVRAGLERRGLRARAARGYQYSWPLPQLMHWNETRLGGALDGLFVRANAGLGALLGARSFGAFDSWVLRFERPA